MDRNSKINIEQIANQEVVELKKSSNIQVQRDMKILDESIRFIKETTELALQNPEIRLSIGSSITDAYLQAIEICNRYRLTSEGKNVPVYMQEAYKSYCSLVATERVTAKNFQ